MGSATQDRVQTPPLQVGGGRSSFTPWAALACLWFMALATLTWTTANPVTVNLLQVRMADSIVRARVVDKSAGQVDVLETLHGMPLTDRKDVGNLASTAAKEGEDYILPLTEWRTGWRITVPKSLDSPNIPPLIYPATPTALASTREIVGAP